MKCPGCGFTGEIDLFCPECNDWVGDPKAEREMEDYSLAMDILAGVYSEDELMVLRSVVQNMRGCE